MCQKDLKNTTERMFFKVKAYNLWFKAGSNGILEGTFDGTKCNMKLSTSLTGSDQVAQIFPDSPIGFLK